MANHLKDRRRLISALAREIFGPGSRREEEDSEILEDAQEKAGE